MVARTCRVCGIPMVTRVAARRVPMPPGHRRHDGRGLCTKDYSLARRAGELIDHERITRSYDETAQEWEILRAQGYTRTQAAERLGLAHQTLSTALQRARAVSA